MKVNDAVLMSKDYVKQCYQNREINETQRLESEQHFLMGLWAMLQLARQMPLEKIDQLEKEIREYQIERVKELEAKGK